MMKNKILKPQTLIAIICLILFSLAATRPVLADDTDIYINQNTNINTAPLVMFSLDWRPNLGNHACNFPGYSSTDYSGIATKCGTGWTATFIQNNFTQTELAKGYITNFQLLRAVLKNTMSTLDGVNIGLMISHAASCKPNQSGPSISGCSNGGYIMYGFHYLDAFDPSNTTKTDFINKLKAIPIPTGNGSPFQGKELYFELYRYLTGQEVYNGHLGWTDYETNATNNLDVDNPNISWDMGAENTTVDSTTGQTIDVLDGNGYPTYVSPISTNMTCSKIFVINIMFQVSSQEDDSDNAIKATIADGGMHLNLSGTTSGFPTVINWMYQKDLADGAHGTAPNVPGTQNVTSYFVTPNVNPTTNGYAAAGGTGNAIDLKFDPTSMAAVFQNIFSQVLSVSTTFVSASVPVNVFNRADYLNDVYLALFQAESTPFWTGNLKKYMLQQDANNNWYIGDTYGTTVFDPSTGRINFNTLSYWTDPNGQDVQTTYNKNEIVGMDGRSVNRGGAGQQIPGFLDGLDEGAGSYTADAEGLSNGASSTSRTLYTEPAAGYSPGAKLTPIDASPTSNDVSNLWQYLNANGDVSSGSTGTLTPDFTAWDTTTLGGTPSTADITEGENILTWARGIDALDADQDGNTDDSRDWIMGDPIHSTPLTINYGDHGSFTQSNPDVRIVLTGNDGFVRMVQNTNSDGTQSGKENWAFIPHASLGLLDRLMKDGVGSPLHPYGVDGAPVAYVLDGNGDGKIDTNAHSPYPNDQVLLFFGMRRGGRHYYAMDITDPDNPTMLWDINGDCTSCNFANLGLTFSTPTVAHMKYVDSSGTAKVHTVLVFGGGYDPANKDVRSSNVVTASDTRGAGIYIVDAETGKLVWKAVNGGTSTSGPVALGNGVYEYDNPSFTDSIPAPVTVLDSDGDGNIDRLYVGDTGGQVWRADLAGTDPDKWSAHVLASIGQRAATGNAKKAIDRRFFHAVDVVQTRNPNTICPSNLSSITTACVQSSYAGLPYDAVIAGTGDRANPLDVGLGNATPPDNWFYVFKDYDVVSGSYNPSNNQVAPYTQGAMSDVSSDCLQTLSCSAGQDLTNGWTIELTQAVGEKALSRPITSYGIIYFTTYLPPPLSTTTTSCAPSEGKGLVYAVNLADGTAAYNWDLTNTTTTASGTFELGQTDRFLPTGLGIPANVISIRKGGENQILIPGKNYLLTQKGQSTFKTFWYTEGE
jgi:type IV pilus assembly protein PilY1